MVFTEVKDEVANYYQAFKDHVNSAFSLFLVIIEIFAETSLIERFKTVLKFGVSFIVFTSIAILLGKGPAQRMNIDKTVHEFCQKYGYKIENETVTTDDGYILTMHRLRCPRNKNNCESKEKRPPILLMHGILGCSADYLAAGPNNSLAFQLVDKGYDVWLGNQRGNTFSREHIMLEADFDSSYWDFSFHEIGSIDVPAMIDHIISKTKFPKITYIGLSQGSLAYLVMTSTKPEYNEKILLSNLLAPVTTLANSDSIMFKIWSTFNFIIEPILNLIGPREFGGHFQWMTGIARYACIGPHLIANWICTEAFIKYGLGSSDQLNYDVLPFYLSNTPAGSSTKQFQHLTQNKIRGQIAQYDYYDQNEEHYNETVPPIYDLTKSIAPVAAYYTRGDIFVNVETLYHALKIMPNVVLKYKVPYAGFNHMDFIYGKDLSVLLNRKVIEIVDKYNKRQ